MKKLNFTVGTSKLAKLRSRLEDNLGKDFSDVRIVGDRLMSTFSFEFLDKSGGLVGRVKLLPDECSYSEKVESKLRSFEKAVSGSVVSEVVGLLDSGDPLGVEFFFKQINATSRKVAVKFSSGGQVLEYPSADVYPYLFTLSLSEIKKLLNELDDFVYAEFKPSDKGFEVEALESDGFFDTFFVETEQTTKRSFVLEKASFDELRKFVVKVEDMGVADPLFSMSLGVPEKREALLVEVLDADCTIFGVPDLGVQVYYTKKFD